MIYQFLKNGNTIKINEIAVYIKLRIMSYLVLYFDIK